MNVLAVDPGMSGAVVLISPLGLTVRRDFKGLPDLTGAITFLGSYIGTEVAVIEMVSARPGQGVTSMFSFGKSAGAAIGALNCLSFYTQPEPGQKQMIEVHPLRWQNYFRRLGYWPVDDLGKLDSRTLARRYYPPAEPFLLRKKDHNTADAVLMALWYILTNDAGSVRGIKKVRPRSRTLKTPDKN